MSNATSVDEATSTRASTESPRAQSRTAGRIIAIALNAFREAVRDRVLYNLVLFVLLLTAAAIFIGGGNTFRLLKALYDFELLHLIQQAVDEGMPYIGSSAGAIVAGPTIKTTKDMPIVQPPSFDSLDLVSFQISPHYLDPDPNSTHMGETQEERINQFLEENDAPVVGLREGTMLLVENGSITLKGTTNARIFRKRHTPVEMGAGSSLDHLLRPTTTTQGGV